MQNNSVWQYISIYYSTTHTQNFLQKSYQHLNNCDQLSFQNSYAFIYYLEHGKKYFDQSLIAPYELQPVLLFYGTVQLMKAVILTVDPYYPETTQVLAHGVSTRKRKKSHYEFIQDEIKVQKNGLVTHFSEKIFDLKQLDGEKFKMGELLARIPELHQYFYYLSKEKIAFPLKKLDHDDRTYLISRKVFDQLHLTDNSLEKFINKNLSASVMCDESNKKNIFLKFNQLLESPYCSPIQFDVQSDTFLIPTKVHLYRKLPELLTHYFLLYNLSMICRYETEWWGELFHHYPSNDLPFIKAFLDITKSKVPYLITHFFKKVDGG